MSTTLAPEAPAWAFDVDPDRSDNFEIIDGVKVEMPPMSADSQVLASRLAVHLSVHGMKQNLGEAYTETLFKLPLPVDRNRRPDVAFVPYSRWAKNRKVPSTNAWDVLPDLCVEVVSPNDYAEEIEDKIEEYFTAGVRQVWVAYPRHQLIFIRQPGLPATVLTRNDTLDGGDVLPGFQMPLAELFPDQD